MFYWYLSVWELVYFVKLKQYDCQMITWMTAYIIRVLRKEHGESKTNYVWFAVRHLVQRISKTVSLNIIAVRNNFFMRVFC